MQRVKATALAAVAAVGLFSAQAAHAQQATIVAHTVDMSMRQARLGLELSTGAEVSIVLGRGVLQVNDVEVAEYPVGGALEGAWRDLLERAASLPTPELRTQLAAWNVTGLLESETLVKGHIDAALRGLPAGPPVAVGGAGAARAAERAQSAAELGERISEQVSERVAEAMERAQVDLDFDPDPNPRAVGSVSNNIAGLLGVFVALGCIGFGLLSFAPRQLQAVSQTLKQSFVRSFMAGLFAQPLLLPVLGMLIVGLVLTVVGIVVLPVAIVAFVVAVLTGLVGGYIAVAGSVGETVTRRRASRPGAAAAAPFRSLVTGLAVLLAVWAPFVLFSWMPGAGTVLLACALVFTWVMVTAGFGAAILSRAGLRTRFTRPDVETFSDSFEWTREIAPARSARKELE